MAKELMRDSVTSVLMRDDATGKLMRNTEIEYGNDCEFCDPGQTPKYITVSISGLVDCLECLWTSVDPLRWFKSSGVAVVLNTAVVILEQNIDNPCLWEKWYTDGDFGTLEIYDEDTCDTLLLEYAFDYLYFSVEKCAVDGLRIQITAAYLGPKMLGWDFRAYGYAETAGDTWTCKTASITNCVDVTDLASVLLCADSADFAFWSIGCEDGLVSIVGGEGIHYAPPSSQYQIRMPTGDDSVEWGRSTGAVNYDLVNEHYTRPDDDTTYTVTNVMGAEDHFSFPVFAIPESSRELILTSHGRFKRMQAGGSYIVRHTIQVNGTVYYGGSYDCPAGFPSIYFDRSYAWSVNPATLLPWTLEDLNGTGSFPLEAQGYQCMAFDKLVRCTQTYIKVTYNYYW